MEKLRAGAYSSVQLVGAWHSPGILPKPQARLLRRCRETTYPTCRSSSTVELQKTDFPLFSFQTESKNTSKASVLSASFDGSPQSKQGLGI